jgi:hypothetical protein
MYLVWQVIRNTVSDRVFLIRLHFSLHPVTMIFLYARMLFPLVLEAEFLASAGMMKPRAIKSLSHNQKLTTIFCFHQPLINPWDTITFQFNPKMTNQQA